jgi:hypothetical protein
MVIGDHPSAGRQLPQPTIDGQPLDVLLGTGFAIVVDDMSVLADLDERWGDLARIVELPAGSLPMTLPAGGAVIVRPDRYVAAVAHDATELAAASTALLEHLAAQPTERPAP